MNIISNQSNIKTFPAILAIGLVVAAGLFYVSPAPLKTFAASLLGDINGDGKVDIFDLSILLSNFGKTSLTGNTSPILSLHNGMISWSAQSGATGYKLAIISAPPGSPSRTTTYQQLGNVTSVTPTAICGVTGYYSVASVGSAGDMWSSEVTITWPACSGGGGNSSLQVGAENILCRSYFSNMMSEAAAAHIIFDRSGGCAGGYPSGISSVQQQAAASGFQIIDNPQSGSDGACEGETPTTIYSDIVASSLALDEQYHQHLMELCNEAMWNSGNAQNPVTYGEMYAAVLQHTQGHVTLAADAAPGNESWFTGVIQGIANYDHVSNNVAAGLIQAWTIHPYGTQGLYGQNMNKFRSEEVASGSTAPVWVTEVGECTGTSSGSGTNCGSGANFPNSVISNAQQATDLTNNLNDLVEATADPGTPYTWCTAWTWYETTNDGSGDFGLFDTNGSSLTPKPSWTALKSWMAMHPQVHG